jgi:hypothetical protein
MYVLVTTDKDRRGVFFGETDETDVKALLGSAVLKNAQCVVYWSADCHGFGGLASKGPTKNCRIGPPVPKLALDGITSATECTTDAVAAFKDEPWA